MKQINPDSMYDIQGRIGNYIYHNMRIEIYSIIDEKITHNLWTVISINIRAPISNTIQYEEY